MTKTSPDTFADRHAAPLEAPQSRGPVRICAACRARVPRDVLLRYVREDAGAGEGESAPSVVFDLDRKRGGRGVNVGPSPLCLERAVKRGAFQRQWRINVSRDSLEVLVAQTRERLSERLTSYLASAWARGGLEAVQSIEEIEPREAQVLWRSEELGHVVTGIPPVRVANPRIAAKIKAFSCAVSEFTFTRAGGMKRRPEAPEACEALERCGGGAIWMAASRSGAAAGKAGFGGSLRTRSASRGQPSLSGPDGRNG